MNLYAYSLNNPYKWVDPSGREAISVEAYAGYGGGLVVGRNKDGSVFLTLKAALGKGGGFTYEPNETSPGYEQTQTEQDFNSYLGFFAEAAVEYGPAKFGAEIHDGLHSINMEDAERYTDSNMPDPGVIITPDIKAKGAKLCVATGIEVGIVWDIKSTIEKLSK